MAQKLAEWQPGTYVRVYGHVRPFGGGRNVQSFAVRAVHDFNEARFGAWSLLYCLFVCFVCFGLGLDCFLSWVFARRGVRLRDPVSVRACEVCNSGRSWPRGRSWQRGRAAGARGG